jgi:hypothetical protein
MSSSLSSDSTSSGTSSLQINVIGGSVAVLTETYGRPISQWVLGLINKLEETYKQCLA